MAVLPRLRRAPATAVLLTGMLAVALAALTPAPAETRERKATRHHHASPPAAHRKLAKKTASRKAKRSTARHKSTPLRLMAVPDAQLEPVSFADLNGWPADNHAAAFAAFLDSCRPVVAGARLRRDSRPMAAALVAPCRDALRAGKLDDAKARAFFEAHFRPVRISRLGETQGFLTGYYEPIIAGSPVRTDEYTIPILRRPRDLIAAGWRGRSKTFPNSVKVFRRADRRKLVPYYERGEIEDGALDGRDLEICWLKDPVDLFFAQIQGSARINLTDGSVLRINYDAHNGHPYTPVGRILIDRQIVPKEEMSMDRIRQWMTANPDGAKELRRFNKSYVFFRVVKLADGDEPVGAQGVSLTPGRSIAVDRNLHVYGTPFWIDGTLPIDSEKPETRFQRLMLSQDTGSAIIGPARADIYFGAGDVAAKIAGRLRHPATFVMLVPRAIDPALAGAHTPLPKPRPASPPPDQKEPAKSAPVVTPTPRPRS